MSSARFRPDATSSPHGAGGTAGARPSPTPRGRSSGETARSPESTGGERSTGPSGSGRPPSSPLSAGGPSASAGRAASAPGGEWGTRGWSLDQWHEHPIPELDDLSTGGGAPDVSHEAGDLDWSTESLAFGTGAPSPAPTATPADAAPSDGGAHPESHDDWFLTPDPLQDPLAPDPHAPLFDPYIMGEE